jgi:3-hydroxyacyl-CoA dehydrogenase/enoyl-CoA hydratase/3-hydroxybutyryl-CoA epimerase/enoyl-CoA isomerase
MQDAAVNVGRDATDVVAGLARTTTDWADVARCDVVIESVIENPLVKRQIFATLEKIARPDTLIASNTSTLPIEQLSSEMQHPERFCGLHFFPPFGERPMLEIIPGSRTGDRTTAALVKFSAALERIPVVVADGRGFLVNCLLMAYMNAAMKLLLAGVDVREIERAALDFGMRVGPVHFYDLIGLDVALNSGFSLAAESDALVSRSPVLLRLVKAKMLGRKTGAGFFVHDQASDDDPVGQVNPRATELIAREVDGPLSLSSEQLTNAILLPVVVEATRLMQLSRARSAGQIDLAVMFGFGFPTQRGGLLHWADQVGAGPIVETLTSLPDLGPHLSPTPLLLEMARRGHRFYDFHAGADLSGPVAAGRTVGEQA